MAEREQRREAVAVAGQQATGKLVACKFSVEQLAPSRPERMEATGVLARAWDGTMAGLDADGEGMDAEAVYELARAYMLQHSLDGHDVQHDKVTDAARLVEIFFNDERITSPLFPPDSCVITLRYHDPEVWRQVKEGELTGFSFEAGVNVELRTYELLVPLEQVRQEAA
jgi:hypothetical protein